MRRIFYFLLGIHFGHVALGVEFQQYTGLDDQGRKCQFDLNYSSLTQGPSQLKIEAFSSLVTVDHPEKVGEYKKLIKNRRALKGFDAKNGLYVRIRLDNDSRPVEIYYESDQLVQADDGMGHYQRRCQIVRSTTVDAPIKPQKPSI